MDEEPNILNFGNNDAADILVNALYVLKPKYKASITPIKVKQNFIGILPVCANVLTTATLLIDRSFLL